MDKVIRNGLVAVLYSPGFGAGWYTWNKEHPEILFDSDVVAWVESGKHGDCPDLAAKYGWEYFINSGCRDLEIKWIPQNTLFNITEYDGNESFVFPNEISWISA